MHQRSGNTSNAVCIYHSVRLGTQEVGRLFVDVVSFLQLEGSERREERSGQFAVCMS